MAKRRPVTSTVSTDSSVPTSAQPRRRFVISTGVACLAIGMLAATIVYSAYHPSDSVAVEQGDALWFTAMAMAIATLTVGSSGRRQVSLISITPWVLGGWMMLSAFATSDIGNLRVSTNEAWVWLAAAAVFTSARSLLAGLAARRSVMTLAMVVASGLAVHGLHQQWVTLPANRIAYQQDPDQVIRMAGLDAPPGTSERMRFENRLFDGGPSATFALANSWAAVLLVGIVIGVGTLRFQFFDLANSQRIIVSALVLLCAAALIAARSRSAVLAMLIAIAWLWLTSSHAIRHNRRFAMVGLIGIAAVGLVGGGLLALFGNREWFEAAPASLAFRFQYWRATWQMVLEHPWFGSGPGNFQAIYEQYREAEATEQISDPHNFFFETLASGGWVAAGLLVTIFIIGTKLVFARKDKANQDESERTESHAPRAVWIGASVALGMVWLMGWALRQIPDLEASFFVIVVAIPVGFLFWPMMRIMSDRQSDSTATATLLALLLHLSVAGGWTVPGVAIWVWISAAMLTRETATVKSALDAIGRPVHRWLKTGLCIAAMVALYFMSWSPSRQAKRWMAIAEMAQSSGQIGKARVSLENAVAADPWAIPPMLWLADYYHWNLIANPNDSQSRLRWEQLIRDAESLAGQNPSVYRQIGIGQIHLYQRHGKAEDLSSAAQSFETMLGYSPSDQWATAQMAVIDEARGDQESSGRLAARAEELSVLGGNLERALFLQSIYPAVRLGAPASSGPVRKPANELLNIR